MQMFSGSRKVEPVTPMAPTPPPAPVRAEPTSNGRRSYRAPAAFCRARFDQGFG